MDEFPDHRRTGFWAGGGSALAAIVVFVLALNNPSEADLRTHVASLARDELISSGNPVLQMMSAEGGQAASQLVSVRADNFVIFSRFEVGIPDTTIVGGLPARRECLIGIMNRFVPCESASAPLTGTPSASPEISSREGLSPPDFALMDGSPVERTDERVLLRTNGWLCDGVRVKFAPETAWETVSVNIAGRTSSWRMTIGSQGLVTIFGAADDRFTGASFEFSAGDLMFNEQACRPAN